MRSKYEALSSDTLFVGGEGWVRGRFLLLSSRLQERPLTPTLSPNDEAVGGEGVAT
jgi:hypothetical protein